MTDYLKEFENVVKASKRPSLKDLIRALKFILGYYLEDFKEFRTDPYQSEVFDSLDEFSNALPLCGNFDDITEIYNSLEIGNSNLPKEFNKVLNEILQKIKTAQEKEERKKAVERKLKGEKKRALQLFDVPLLIARHQQKIAAAGFSLEAIISGILKLSKVLRKNDKITREEKEAALLIDIQMSEWGEQIIMREGELILTTRSVEDIMKNLNKILPDNQLQEMPENLIFWKMGFGEKIDSLEKKGFFKEYYQQRRPTEKYHVATSNFLALKNNNEMILERDILGSLLVSIFMKEYEPLRTKVYDLILKESATPSRDDILELFDTNYSAFRKRELVDDLRYFLDEELKITDREKRSNPRSEYLIYYNSLMKRQIAVNQPKLEKPSVTIHIGEDLNRLKI